MSCNTCCRRVDFFKGTEIVSDRKRGSCIGGCISIMIVMVTMMVLAHDLMAMLQRTQTEFHTEVIKGSLPLDTSFSQ